MNSIDPWQLLQRAEICAKGRRYEEASTYLQEAIALKPSLVPAYLQLALVRVEIPAQRDRALEAVESALALAGDSPEVHRVHSHVLLRLERGKESLQAAEAGIELNPDDDGLWCAKAGALSELERWPEAEEAAKNALRLDADNQLAMNLLAVSLRIQGKVEEAQAVVDAALHQDANDSDALASKGWGLLQRGDVEKAEELFCDALSVEPENRYAREGLKQAYKSRSPFYRLYLKWVFWMQRFSSGKRFAIGIGLYVVFRMTNQLVEGYDQLLQGGLVALWLGFVCWTTLAPAIGNFLLLIDSRARLTLDPWEGRQGAWVGGMFVLSLSLLAVGLFGLVLAGSMGWEALAMGGIFMGVACLPGARVFGNGSKLGRIIFGLFWIWGSLAATMLVAKFLGAASGRYALPEWVNGVALLGVIGAALSTWLTFFSTLVKPVDGENEG